MRQSRERHHRSRASEHEKHARSTPQKRTDKDNKNKENEAESPFYGARPGRKADNPASDTEDRIPHVTFVLDASIEGNTRGPAYADPKCTMR